MQPSIENKIRLKAIFIYIIVAAICLGMIVYVYNLRSSIDNYKDNIAHYYDQISQVDSLIRSINQAQTEATQFITTKDEVYFEEFNKSLEEIEFVLDSLAEQGQEIAEAHIFTEINLLLKEKGEIITSLDKQFRNSRNPVRPLQKKLESQEPLLKTDSVTITTVVQDTTIVPLGKKKNFWRRLSNVFVPEKPRDSIFTVSTSVIDTVIVKQNDTIPLAKEITTYTDIVKKEYVSRISAIERQVNNLLSADQEISTRISGILVDLYRNAVGNILLQIEENEDFIRRNNNRAVVWGIIALILVLVCIIYIFNDLQIGFKARVALQEANKKIRQTMESRHKLLLSVSHDIKTPLNSIMGHLDKDNSRETLTAKDIKSMKNSGTHIFSLLSNLLEFSGLEQGSLQLSPTPFNLDELCRVTAEMCDPLVRQKNLYFNTQFNFDSKLYLNSDSLKIKQIIINILSNAIKYTVEGGIDFNVEYENETLKVTIADTGVGIPEDQQHLLFRPFTRIENNSFLAEGSGFGMYVVEGLTQLLGGEIKVESQVGKGTKITVAIPAPKVEIRESSSSKKLLLIDDDPPFLSMLKDMFQRIGHSADICNSLSELEAKMNSIFSYDMIVTDMEMGTVTGKDILKKIRNKNASIPVVIMTARGDFNNTTAAELGFTGYLQKPVTASSLKVLVNGQAEPVNEFELLEEMFDHDKEAITEILQIFVESTFDNLEALRQALAKDDFHRAQKLCHTMLPMFLQIGAQDAGEILKKMDALRSAKPEEHLEWKHDIQELLIKTDALLEKIQARYPAYSSVIL